MGLFDQFPYTNFHELNLDWILGKLKELDATMVNFINLNTIKYADPIEWDITRQYEANTVVVDNRTGNAYISTHEVPDGVHITNTDYWTVIYNYQFSLEKLQKQITPIDEEDNTTATAPRQVGELVWLSGELFRITAPMIAGDMYVDGSNCRHITVEEYIHESIAEDLLSGLKAHFDNVQIDNDVYVGGSVNVEQINSTNDLFLNTDGTIKYNHNPSLFNRYFKSIPFKDNNDNTYNVLVENDDLDLLSAYHYVFTNEALIGDGATLNDDKWDELLNKIGNDRALVVVDSGVFKFTSFTAPDNIILRFEGGSIDAPVISIAGDIIAPRYQIFNNISNITVSNQNIWGYPEWFGVINRDITKATQNHAALTTANATFSRLSFAFGIYYVDDTLTINTSNHHWKGVDNNQGVSNIQSTNLNAPIVIIGGADLEPEQAVRYVKLNNINLAYTEDATSETSRALEVITAVDVNVENCWIHHAKYAITCSNSWVVRFRDMHFSMPEIAGATVFDITSMTTHHFTDFEGENNVLYIENCACALNNLTLGTYGVHFHDTEWGFADTYIDDLQLGRFGVGICLDLEYCAHQRSLQDGLFTRLFFDRMDCCIQVKNEGSVYTPLQFIVSDCYFNTTTESAAPVFVKLFAEAANSNLRYAQITFANCMFIAGFHTENIVKGFVMNARGVVLKGCQFKWMSANIITGYFNECDFDFSVWSNRQATGAILNATYAYKCRFKITCTGQVAGNVPIADLAISDTGIYRGCMFDFIAFDSTMVTDYFTENNQYLVGLAEFAINTYKNTALGIVV